MSQKISQLPSVIAANISDTDIIPLVATNITSKVTVANLRTKLGTQPPTGGRTVTDAFTYLTNNAVFNVKDFGAFGDGVTDDITAINAAITAAKAAGGIVFFPKGAYKTTAPLNLTNAGTANSTWIKLLGEGPRTSQINGIHTGHMIDAVGRSFVTIENLSTSGNGVTIPKTAIFFGRNNTNNSAGNHILKNVHTLGTYSVAAVYNYASEVMRVYNSQLTNSSNGSAVAIITALNISTLTSTFVTITTGTKSNTVFQFYGTELNNYAVSGNADCLYLEGVSSLLFSGGFMITNGGRSFVWIDATTNPAFNISIKDVMWDGSATTTYGVVVTGAISVTRLTLENIYGGGAIKAFGSGGMTFYGQDGSGIANLKIINVFTTNAYFRLYEVDYSEITLGQADTLYLKYSCTGNKITTNSTTFVADRLDLSPGNTVYFLNTATVGNPADTANRGDANVVLTATLHEVVLFESALTANRTVTLPANAASSKTQKFRIVRTGLGAFTLTVQDATPTTLKVMPAGTSAYVEVTFIGGIWKLTGYGTL